MSNAVQKIVTQCTLCNEHLRLDAKYVANRIRCPKCSGVFEVQAVKFGEESSALASRDALATTADITQPVRTELSNAVPSVASEIVPVDSLAYASGRDHPASGKSADNVPSTIHAKSASNRKSTDLARNGDGVAKKIGRYEIKEELGRGTFGAVFAANDPLLQRRVAIKLQTRELDDKSFEKMLQEARASAKLRHPNIVAVFEVDSDQRRPFVVSELIDGKNLADKIAEGPMESKFAATIIRDVARGLAYAHSEGLIHRDVKPQNILIDGDNRPQVTDFGLAVDRNDEQQRESAAYSRAGTLAYMAPEQAGVGASSVGPAVDQYAIAATLFELLCGQRPHAGGSLEIVKGLEQPEPPRVRSIRSEVPIDLDAICFKAMSHEPWKRYESCEALADDLDRYLNGELIKGRKIGLIERATHYAKKHPRIAAGIIGGSIAASGLLLTTTTLVIRNVYLASKQTQTLKDQMAKTNTTIKETTGIGRIQDGSESADLPLWLAYSRKLNSAARADSIGDKELFGKLLDESQENFREWEYRHLEARRKQGLISSFSIQQP
jgi:serine/threonine protein kinase